jgi:predicted permease
MAAAYVVYRRNPGSKIDRPAFGVMVLAAGFGNVTYLGLPVITGMLGAQFGYVAILYDLLAATPVLLTVGVFAAARYGSGKNVSFGASLLRVLKLPPLWGVAAGGLVQVFGLAVPLVVQDAAGLMGRGGHSGHDLTVGWRSTSRTCGGWRSPCRRCC